MASFAGGSVLGLSILFPTLFWSAALIALIPLVLGIAVSGGAMQAARRGYVFGLGLMGFVLSWGLLSYPLDWLGIANAHISLFIVGGVWLFCTTILALPFFLYAAAAFYLRYIPSIFFIPGHVLLFVCFEQFRALFYVLLMYGSGSMLGAHFSNGFIGYALTGSNLLWLAAVGGVYTLTAVAVFSSASTAYFLVHSAKQLSVAGLLVPAFFCIAGIFLPPAVAVLVDAKSFQVHGLTFSLVHTDFPRTVRVDQNQAVYREQVQAQKILQTVEAGPVRQVVVLPEGGRFIGRMNLLPVKEQQKLLDILKQKEVLLIDSGRTHTADGLTNAVIWFSGGEGRIIKQDAKQLLSPFGEYMPYLFKYAMSYLGFMNQITQYEQERSYVAGPGPFLWQNRSIVYSGVTIGTLECSEVVSPSLYAELGMHTDVLVGVSSAAWAQGSSLLGNQILAMEKVHAVETGKPYLRATNMGPNEVIIPLRLSF